MFEPPTATKGVKLPLRTAFTSPAESFPLSVLFPSDEAPPDSVPADVPPASPKASRTAASTAFVMPTEAKKSAPEFSKVVVAARVSVRDLDCSVRELDSAVKSRLFPSSLNFVVPLYSTTPLCTGFVISVAASVSSREKCRSSPC